MKPFPLETMLSEVRGVLTQIRISADGVVGALDPLQPL
jgi:hypothetical protein